MTALDVSHHSAMTGLVALLGTDAARFESTVYQLTSNLTVNDAEAGLTRYQGGCWKLVAADTEAGTAYWWRLDSDDRYRFLNPGNGSEETVDAELLSLVVNLMALSHLCIYHYQKINLKLNEAYAQLHEALKVFCYSHLQGDETRLRQFAAMID